MEERRSSPVRFEKLPLAVLYRVRKSLRRSHHLELRKATRVWHEVAEGRVQLDIDSLPMLLEDLRNSKSFLQFNHIDIDEQIYARLQDIDKDIDQAEFKLLNYSLRQTKAYIRDLLNLMPRARLTGYLEARCVELFNLPKPDTESATALFHLDAHLRNGKYIITDFEIFWPLTEPYANRLLSAITNHLVSFSFPDIKREQTISDAVWINFIQQLHKLQYLHINVQPNIAELFADHLPLKAPLHCLDLKYTVFRIIEKYFLKWGKTINKFMILIGIEDNDLADYTAFLGHAHAIRKLNLLIFDTPSVAHIRRNLLAEIKQYLQELNISTCYLPENELNALIEELPSLIELRLDGRPEGVITEATLATIFEHSTKLRRLRLCVDYHLHNIRVFSNISRLRALQLIQIHIIFDPKDYDELLRLINELPEIGIQQYYGDLKEYAETKSIYKNKIEKWS